MNPSTTTDPSLELRDIKPAIEIPAAAGGWPLWATISLFCFAVALAILGWWLMRRRCAPVKPTASETALAELQGLHHSDAPAEAYVMQVSDILRRYIQSRYEIGASRQTTEEFFETISASPSGLISREHQIALRQFLVRCDEVKFARGDLDQGQRERLHEVARSFVETSAAEPAPDAAPSTPKLQPSPQH